MAKLTNYMMPQTENKYQTLLQQNRLLQEENTRLQHELKGVAEASVLAVELMVELEEAKENLSQSQALLTSVLDSSLDGIMVYQAVSDEQGQICDFEWRLLNPAAARMVQKTSEQLIGERLLQHFPFVQTMGLFEQFVRVVQTGQPLDQEIHIQEGSIDAWVHLVAVKIDNGLSVTFRNITERKIMALKLEQQANQDGLTGIANRRVCDEYLQREWKRCSRNQTPIALILFDIDYFKLYNDTYGHILGDHCLTLVAQAVSRALKRPGDMVARYGGEEFVVILPDTGTDGARKVANDIAQEIQSLQIEHQASRVNDFVTASMGVISLVPQSEWQPAQLLQAADDALYEAKRKGRNQISIG